MYCYWNTNYAQSSTLHSSFQREDKLWTPSSLLIHNIHLPLLQSSISYHLKFSCIQRCQTFLHVIKWWTHTNHSIHMSKIWLIFWWLSLTQSKSYDMLTLCSTQSHSWSLSWCVLFYNAKNNTANMLRHSRSL